MQHFDHLVGDPWGIDSSLLGAVGRAGNDLVALMDVLGARRFTPCQAEAEAPGPYRLPNEKSVMLLPGTFQVPLSRSHDRPLPNVQGVA